MGTDLKNIYERVASGSPLSREEALGLTEALGPDLFELLQYANRLRTAHSGDAVRFCSIINARSGRCGEDCAFCAQSGHHGASPEAYPLVDADAILEAAAAARDRGANEFSIVTSGRGVRGPDDLETIRTATARIGRDLPLSRCASLGELGPEEAKALKTAGLDRYHHNLETAESFFPSICSTHTFQDRLASIRNALDAGLQVCSGGIFGLGESPAQRVEMAFTLRELGVHSVPINFLNPIPGTPLENRPRLDPIECLAIIALFRFVLPDRDIVVCGGREVCLRDLQPLLFIAGANGLLLGDYLTTRGRAPEDDLEMIRDLGLRPVAGDCGAEAGNAGADRGSGPEDPREASC